MKVWMKALRKQAYAGKVVEAGAAFEADNEQDANTLTLVGFASRGPDEPPKRQNYRRRDLQAEH